MTEGRRSPDVRPMTHNVDEILDAHTHLTGSEDPEQIRGLLDFSHCSNVLPVNQRKGERVGFEPTRRFNTAYAISSPKSHVLLRTVASDNLPDLQDI